MLSCFCAECVLESCSAPYLPFLDNLICLYYVLFPVRQVQQSSLFSLSSYETVLML